MCRGSWGWGKCGDSLGCNKRPSLCSCVIRKKCSDGILIYLCDNCDWKWQRWKRQSTAWKYTPVAFTISHSSDAVETGALKLLFRSTCVELCDSFCNSQLCFKLHCTLLCLFLFSLNGWMFSWHQQWVVSCVCPSGSPPNLCSIGLLLCFLLCYGK